MGAGTFDRVCLFGTRDEDNLKIHAKLKKPSLWVTEKLDVADKEASNDLIFATLKEALEAAMDMEEDEVVIQIQDSGLYLEGTIDVQSNSFKYLTIQAANECRPIILLTHGDSINLKSDLKSFTLNGLQVMSHGSATDSGSAADPIDSAVISVSASLDEMHIIFSTINPSLKAFRLSIKEADVDNLFLDFKIDRSIIGGIDVGNTNVDLNINNSIIDGMREKDALVGNKLGCKMNRSTIVGNVSINTLYASETIFDGLVIVKNRQDGCVRYSRFTPVSYLFDWNKIKNQNGNDNDKLKEFLVRNFDETEWITDASITNDGATITIKSTPSEIQRSLMINIKDEIDRAVFVLDDKIYRFSAKIKAGGTSGIFAHSAFPRLFKCPARSPF